MEAELFDGTILEFPDGTPGEVIDRVVKQETETRRGQGMAWGDVGRQAVGNIVPSAIGVGQSMYQAVRHPIDTATGLAGMAAGGIQEVASGGVHQMPDAIDQRAKFGAFMDMLKQRYGGVPELKKTLATDPVGALLDVSSVATGGSAGLGRAGLTRAARAVGKVAEYTDPVTLLGKAAASVVTPEKLIISALKPGTRMKPADRARAIETALREKVAVNQRGLDKLEAMIAQRGEEADRIIAGYPGMTVSREAVLERAYPVMEEAYRGGDASANTAKVADVISDFEKTKPESIPLTDAQKIKKVLNREINWDQLSPTYKTEAMRQIERGLKEEIAKKAPDVQRVNSLMSEYYNLLGALEPAVARTANANVLPLTAAAMSGASAPVAAGVGFLGFPTVKSKMAFLLDEARRGNIGLPTATVPFTQIPLRIGRGGRALAYGGGLLNQIPMMEE